MATKQERIKYIDTLKFLAIIAIVGIHIFGLFPYQKILGFKIISLKEITRFGVPIFLMISGALLLNRDMDLESFLKKRVIRIMIPLIFYLIIAFILNIYRAPLEAYWYCWMIICSYLAIPIINIFIKNAKMKEIEYFLILFIIATLIYQLCIKFGIKHCLDLNFFIGPISFLILGYYLSKKDFKLSSNKMIIISIFLYIISTILIIKYGDYFKFNTGNLISYLPTSVSMILQSISVFLMFRFLYESKKGIFSKIKSLLEVNLINKIILSISRSSYGIYLLQMLILRGFLDHYIPTISLTGTEVCVSIISLTIGLLIISWVVVVILGKIPYIKQISGYA